MWPCTIVTTKEILLTEIIGENTVRICGSHILIFPFSSVKWNVLNKFPSTDNTYFKKLKDEILGHSSKHLVAMTNLQVEKEVQMLTKKRKLVGSYWQAQWHLFNSSQNLLLDKTVLNLSFRFNGNSTNPEK